LVVVWPLLVVVWPEPELVVEPELGWLELLCDPFWPDVVVWPELPSLG
jgi:hypothetical protein